MVVFSLIEKYRAEEDEMVSSFVVRGEDDLGMRDGGRLYR